MVGRGCVEGRTERERDGLLYFKGDNYIKTETSQQILDFILCFVYDAHKNLSGFKL